MFLQTLDNILTLKMLADKGYDVPGQIVFVADQWGEHLLDHALGIIFGCKVVEREIVRKTSNGTYQDREMVIPLSDYDEWSRLKEKFPEMKQDEEEMCGLSFDCSFQGCGPSIRFDRDGIVVENGYDTSFYAHSLIDDFITLKHMWIECLNKWRNREVENHGYSIERRVEDCSSEASLEIGQCA
jgi:hypothetical protein